MTGYDADLDHYPEDLLWGLKTEKFESQRESFDTTPFELFDGLVWPGEDLLKNDEPIDFPVLESKHWEPEFIRMKRRVLNNSLLELQSLFSKRIVNAHCIPSEALKYGRRTLHMYRQYPIGLVGAYYNNRIYIKDILKRSRVKNAPFDEYERFVSRTNGAIGKLEALGVDGVRIKKMQRAIRFLSQQSLFLQSKMAWVDPGYFGYLVRKYFEAPMAGAALIGQTNFSNESKGFIKDTTMLVSEGQDVIDLIQVSERERLCLVNNSLDMLSELHTGEARAKQILKGITDESTEYIYTFRGAKHVKLNGEKE
jgi:hypothetical protein